jgi:hypothetical protein
MYQLPMEDVQHYLHSKNLAITHFHLNKYVKKYPRYSGFQRQRYHYQYLENVSDFDSQKAWWISLLASLNQRPVICIFAGGFLSLSGHHLDPAFTPLLWKEKPFRM